MSEYNSRTEKKEKIKEQQKKKKEKKNSAKKEKKGFWKKFLYTCLVLFIVGVVGVVSAFWWIIRDVPELDETLLKAPQSSLLLASDGETVLAEVGEERRDNVTVDQIPEILKNAILAAEDVNFFEHHGIDIPRTIASIWQTFVRGNTQGGSTITQQVTRMAFLTQEQTVTRKIQEWYLSVQLERRFSKDQILEMFVNKNLYGGNVFGIAKAAERFFGLSIDELDQLTLEQAALLAGIPQRPNAFNPLVEDNLERAENRRNIVLRLMHRHEFITEETMKAAQSTPIEDTLDIHRAPTNQFQAFVDTAISEAQERTDANIFEDGLRIYTTLDPNIQQITEDVISTRDYINFPDNDNLETAVVITDTQTGAIRAIGGGRNYQAGGFNYATMSNLQPGSAVKPLISFGPAINKLKWSTGHLVVDEPTTYADGTPLRNANRSYAGERTIRDHLAWSRNTPSLYAYRAAGAAYAVEFARGLGLPISDTQAANESNAVGTMATANPRNLAGAYAAFGNGGYHIEPFTVYKIVHPDGTEENVTPNKERVMEDYTAFLITDMLRTAVHSGTGQRANVSRLDIAGKTGSTSFDPRTIAQVGLPENGTRDSWFVGYTTEFTGAVWTGFSQSRTPDDYLRAANGSTHISQQVFREIFSRVATSTERFQRPNSVGRLGDEYYVIGGEMPQAPTPDAVTNLTGTFNEEANSIQLAWDFSSNSSADVTFTISYSVDGQTNTLPATSDMSASLSNPERGKTYTFTVTAVSGESESDPATVSVAVPEEEEEVELPSSPTNVTPRYENGSIIVTWNHDDAENVTFTVTYTVGGATSTATASGMQATIPNAQAGQTYSISVTATNEAGTSQPGSVTFTVPATTPGGDNGGGTTGGNNGGGDNGNNGGGNDGNNGGGNDGGNDGDDTGGETGGGDTSGETGGETDGENPSSDDSDNTEAHSNNTRREDE